MITDTKRDHVVRNRALTTMPGGPAPLDLVVDVQQQKEWPNGVLDAYPDDRRTKEAERRLRTPRTFEKLAALPQFTDALADLTTYVSHVIPWHSGSCAADRRPTRSSTATPCSTTSSRGSTGSEVCERSLLRPEIR